MAVDKAVPYHGLSWLLAHGMDRGYFHTVSQSSIYGRIPYTVLCAALPVQLLQVNNQSEHRSAIFAFPPPLTTSLVFCHFIALGMTDVPTLQVLGHLRRSVISHSYQTKTLFGA
jgi:hypothetical protein